MNPLTEISELRGAVPVTGSALLLACLPRRSAMVRLLGWVAAESLPTLLFGLCLARAIDALQGGRPAAALGALAVMAASIVLGAIATRILYSALAIVVDDFRDTLMTAVVRGSLLRLAQDGRPGRNTLAQLIDQVDEVRNLLSAVLRGIRSTLAPPIAVCVGLFALDQRLGWAVLIPLGAALGCYVTLLRSVLRRERAATVAGERLGACAGSIFQSIDDIRGLAAQQWARETIDAAVQKAAAADAAAARTLAKRHLIIAVGGYLPLFTVFLLAAPLLAQHRITVGAVVGATTYLLTVLVPALSSVVSGSGGWFIQLRVLLERLALVADAPLPADRPNRSTAFEHVAGGLGDDRSQDLALGVSDLTFAYRPDARAIVDGLSFSLKKGEMLAMVGASGAGKSTVALLLSGLVPPTSGSVVAGRGQHVLLVPSQPYVFGASLRDNLTYLATEPVADDCLSSCIDHCGLSSVVNRLGGIDGMIPTSLDGLSGSDCQRIVLARSYLSGSQVLILDEATSLLDLAEERRLVAWLRDGGRTLVLISHRLDCAADADRILYFDGRDVVTGSHRELLVKSADYVAVIDFAAEAG